MLKFMRKNARSWLMQVLLGIIIVVFIFYFGSLRGEKKAEYIAFVDDIPVSYGETAREYQNLIEFYRQRYGDKLSDDVLKTLKLKEQALENLINQKIILLKAEELNLKASNEEVKSAILTYPAFQRENKFDSALYRQILRYQKMTPEGFEAMQRRMLTIQKMQGLIKEAAKVSEKEVQDLYRIENEKINVNFIKVTSNTSKMVIKPSEEDLDNFLREHGTEFRKPRKMKVKYIEFKGNEFSESLVIADEDIEEYYNDHTEEFSESEGKFLPLSEVRAKIIARLKQVRGMDVALEEAKKANYIIYQEENFDEYAEENKLKTGETDFFTQKKLPAELVNIEGIDKRISMLSEGEISSVLSSPEAHYIIKIITTEPSYIPELQEVKVAVEKRYTENKSKELCRDKAVSILERLKKGEEIQKVASKENLGLSETGLFLPISTVPKIGFSPELVKALFEISEKSPYPEKPFLIDDNYVIIQFKERGDLDNKNWEKRKESLNHYLMNLREEELFESWLKETKTSMIKNGKIKIFENAANI